MGIETGFYQNLKPVELINPVEAQGNAMKLSQMAMQNQALQNDMAKESQAQKEAKEQKQLMAIGGAVKHVRSLPDDQQESAWNEYQNKFLQDGLIDKEHMTPYSKNTLGMLSYKIDNNPAFLAMEKSRAELAKTNAEAAHQYALAKRGGVSSSDGDDLYKQLRNEKIKQELEEKRFAKTPEGRLKGLGAEENKRLDNAKLGLISVQGMADALESGDNTFSIVGDNNFTQQRALFEEALGRMQSGGAIGVKEAEAFKKMAPGIGDSKEMQIKKLAQLQNEMKSRIGTLGFKPEEVGLTVRKIQMKENGSSVLPSANAGSDVKTPMSEEQFIEAFLKAKKSSK